MTVHRDGARRVVAQRPARVCLRARAVMHMRAITFAWVCVATIACARTTTSASAGVRNQDGSAAPDTYRSNRHVVLRMEQGDVAFDRRHGVEDMVTIPQARVTRWLRLPAARPATELGGVVALSKDTTRGVIVFVAKPDRNGFVQIDAHYVRQAYDRRFSFVVRGTAMPVIDSVPQCTSDPWVAAFFIDGVGARPVGDVTVAFLGRDTMQTLRINGAHNTLRASPSLEYHLRDLAERDPDGIRHIVTYFEADTLQPALVHLLVNQTANGWNASGFSARTGWPHIYFASETTPDDLWRLYLFDDPNACRGGWAR